MSWIDMERISGGSQGILFRYIWRLVLPGHFPADIYYLALLQMSA
ncbi:hypothetical protein [Desulfosporosinus shakirovi]|nr:hypothetical protein [Desulfosporosinus sp. SRJS8]